MLSSVHRGNAHVAVTRNTKVDGQHVQLELRQPKCIHDYNKKMRGVDSFDQQAAAYRALHRTRKYWKSIFLDIIDVAAVNSFIMFEMWRLQHLGVTEQRKHLRHSDFQANLICQLADIGVHEPALPSITTRQPASSSIDASCMSP